MYAIVVTTETGALSLFLVDIAIYIQIRVYYVRFTYVECVCANENAVEASERMCRIW